MKMLSIAILTATLAAACGGTPTEEDAVVETNSALTNINYICLTNGSDPASLYPWQASYPLAGQHPFCQHIPTEVPSSPRRPWPAGISKCPTNGTHAGARQLDVWLADNAAPTNYYCARVSLTAAGGSFSLDYVPLMEMGWLTASLNPSQTRIIQGVWVGPGSSAVVDSASTANPLGCSVPTNGCASMQVPSNGVTSWMPVSAGGFQAASLNFH